MGVIQVMGEALIDIIVDINGEVESVVGGAPVTTARSIARLGHEVSYLGGISRDSFGQRIKRHLEQDKVEIAIKDLRWEPSPVALAVLDELGAASYRFLIDDTAASSVTIEMALESYDPTARAIHIGTLAFVLDPLARACRHVIDSMPVNQILMIDPNARPSVMSDSAFFRENLEHALRRADVIKVSGDDLNFLLPHLSSMEAAKELHSSSGAVVLFTDGAESVSVFVQGERATVEVPKVNVIDTVGAGDSLSGGFLAFWAQHDWHRTELSDLKKVLAATDFGVRVASLTCQASGAQPPFAHEL